jgi:hypothetical protein
MSNTNAALSFNPFTNQNQQQQQQSNRLQVGTTINKYFNVV